MKFGNLTRMAVAGCILVCMAWGSDISAAPADKVSPVILAHREAKRRPIALDAAAHRAALQAGGMNGDDLDGETCALYATGRLSDAEQQELAARGIDITPGLWIPPLAGRHPQGFHLARVAYASLDTVRNDPRMVRLESAEMRARPMNNLATSMIKADLVRKGSGTPPFTGDGVRIAVADSGLDLTHGDFPVPVEAYDMTTGSSPLTWSTTVANTASAHGTHVTASALGRGTLSGGLYRGSAPDADLCFYKIGDSTASASEGDMIEAINRAVDANARIFSLSYGGFSTYLDGSEPAEQAIDAAVAAGVTVFVAAGNEGDADLHDSISVAPGTTSDSFGFTLDNTQGSGTYQATEYLQVIWRGGTPSTYDISLTCTNLVSKGAGKETLTLVSSSTSIRGTKSREYALVPNVAAETSKTYYFRLQNTTGGTPITVHLYQTRGMGTFDSPDSSYTVGHPAVADGAIAVGAWTQRKDWKDYMGNRWQYSDLTVGTLAPFSSRGPRIDGLRKPEIVAPGAATISARDSVPTLADFPARIIDNDGLNLNGSGPADYYVMQGTSMACPMAAGVAALMLQGNPGLTPAEIRAALTNTASRAATPDDAVGSGLIDAQAAVLQTSPLAPLGTPEYWLAAHGLTNGSFAAAELLDHDGDGLATWEEYIADTDPTNSQSVLAFSSITTDNEGLRLTWAGGQWARQYLDARGSLGTSSLPWVCILTNDALPTAITNTTLRPLPDGGHRFYRIRAER